MECRLTLPQGINFEVPSVEARHFGSGIVTVREVPEVPPSGDLVVRWDTDVIQFAATTPSGSYRVEYRRPALLGIGVERCKVVTGLRACFMWLALRTPMESTDRYYVLSGDASKAKQLVHFVERLGSYRFPLPVVSLT
jgi:hypothetical protein